jgi:hypothetical protein
MSHWINPEQNLGIIKAGSPRRIVFKAFETLPVIKTISPYCGCTATSFNLETKELYITYSNATIPNQVVGAQATTKRIDIIYEDDSVDILIIKATRIR